MTKRYIEVGTERFEITKVTAIKSDTVPFLVHIDKLPDGTYRLTYNASLITNIDQVPGFLIIRED